MQHGPVWEKWCHQRNGKWSVNSRQSKTTTTDALAIRHLDPDVCNQGELCLSIRRTQMLQPTFFSLLLVLQYASNSIPWFFLIQYRFITNNLIPGFEASTVWRGNEKNSKCLKLTHIFLLLFIRIKCKKQWSRGKLEYGSWVRITHKMKV